MSAEAQLLNMTQQVRGLLDCAAVSLLLGCPEPALRHPILDMLPTDPSSYTTWHGSVELATVLQDEQVQALCDLAMQTGRVQSLNHCDAWASSMSIQSLAVVPLALPTGIPGFLLLTDPSPGAFQQGEVMLLNDYLPGVLLELEQDLYSLAQYPHTDRAREEVKEEQQAPAQATLDYPVSGEQPETAERIRTEFVSMVSHELRAPLSAIKGYAGILQAYSIPDRLNGNETEGELTIARQRHYLDIIMEQVNHLEILISDLLDVSRIQAGRLALRCSAVDIIPLCEQVTQIVRIEQQQVAQSSIQCTFTQALPLVWADPVRVQQVLTNLLENAIKYSPDGGTIEITASTQPGFSMSDEPLVTAMAQASTTDNPPMLSITVRDQGIGIPPQQQMRLFQPFSRLEPPSTEQVPGAGLGLYISRKLVEAMGGNVTIASCEGKGTSVTFTLPLLSPASAM
jgi:signal transduction histidine kinase